VTRERFALIVATAHFAAAVLHGIAHGELGLPAGGIAGQLFVAGTVCAGPFAALALLDRGKRNAGAMLMSASMSAALGYGLTFHYFITAADNIARFPSGSWAAVFRYTAAIIALLEAAGAVAGALLLTTHRLPDRPAGTATRRAAAWIDGGSPREWQ